MESTQQIDSSQPLLGLGLSIFSSLLVGSSFIFQKIALNKTSKDKSNSAGFAYLHEWVWWAGMLSMAVGEVLNFAAYSMAPAILIALLGALRVVVTAVLAHIFLNEKLDGRGKIGVFLSLLGSTIIVIYSPKHELVTSFEQVVVHFADTGFLAYSAVLIVATLVLIFHSAPRYGDSNIMVYISICNIIGAIAVLLGKGLAIALKEMFSEPREVLFHPLFWILILGNVVGILLQIVYLNKALAMFNTQLITPIKYVFTNLFLVVGSILLFQEFAFMTVTDVIGMAAGFATIVAGVILLNPRTS